MVDDRLGTSAVEAGFDVPLYALGAVVYVERGDEILLLQRAEGSALAGQWFLPGGAVERGELPEDGARRELREEAGIEIEGELELIGAYPMHVYGLDMLQLSYRGRAADAADVTISHEHVGARWVRPQDMQALLTEDFITQLAAGDERVGSLLRHIAADLDTYLRRTS
jgi:8-oxo-dGTP pyrophosphatase MutT (NUDIX family)